MARFIYLGEEVTGRHKKSVMAYGPTLRIRFHLKDGTKYDLSPPGDDEHFEVGKDLGIDIDDERVLRHLRKDPRFKEIKE